MQFYLGGGGSEEKKWNTVWCLSVTFECKLLSPSREIRVMARLSAITQHCWIYARACRSPVVTAMSPTRSLVWMSTTPTRFRSGLPQKSVLHSMRPMCTFLSTVKVAYHPNTPTYTHTQTHQINRELCHEIIATMEKMKCSFEMLYFFNVYTPW